MATFSELQTRVGQIVIDLPSTVTAQLPTLVKEAVRELQDLHNFFVMEALSSVFTTTVQNEILGAVPSDFKEFRGKPYLIEAYGNTRDIEPVSGRSEAINYFGTTAGGEADVSTLDGRPQVIFRGEPTSEAGASNFIVYPLPDLLSLYANGNYRIRVPYWKYLTALSGSSDSNWFTVNGEEYIVFKAASMAFYDNQDAVSGQAWASLANPKFQQIVNLDKRFRASGITTLIPQQFSKRGPHSKGGGFLPGRRI